MVDTQDEPTRRTEPRVLSVVDSDSATPFVARPKPETEPPRRIDRFTVLERVGAGGVGVVYSAYDPRLDRRVALKLLKPTGGEGSDTEDAKGRFLQEGKAMARLQHPNVLTVYDVGVHLDEVFLVLELVEDGRSLGEHLSTHKLGWREVVALYLAAGRGLAAAHAEGLVHRDFKPANVLVGSDGRVRVMDFGLARMRGTDAFDPTAKVDGAGGDEDLFQTIPGSTMGTPAYMAPEQHLGEEVDARADQFAFCVALYQGLYGQRPFAWTTAEELEAAVLAGDVRPPPADSPVPGWVRRIVLRGLARHREDRWPSMRALLSALARDPRRRWIQAAAVVGTLAAAVGVGLFASAFEEREATCDGGQARLAGIWDDARKHELAARFAEVDPDLGVRTWDKVEARLDRYVDEWSERHREVCEATEIDHDQSREVMHFKMFCLERHAFELEGFTQALARADNTTLRRAIEGTVELTPVDSCPRGAFDAQLEFDPDDATLERLTKLRAQLAQAGGLQSAGDYEGGVTLAREVLAEAESLGYRAFEAEARLRLGSLLHYAGDYEESAEQLREAGWAAEEGRVDFAAAQAQTILAHVVSRHLAQYEAGELWARHAEAAIGRMRPPDEALRAKLMAYRGAMKKDQGDYAGAVEELARALEIRARRLGEGHAEVGYVHGELGSTYAAMGDDRAARMHYRRAYEIHRDVLGEGHPELAPDLDNLGVVELRVGDPSTAQAQFEEAIRLYESMKEEIIPETGEVYGHLGSALAAQGRHRAARRAHERSLEILRAAHGDRHPTEAAVQMSIARAALDAGELDDATHAVEIALGIWRETFDASHPQIGEAQALLGEVRLAAGEPAGAVEAFERALAIRTETFGEVHGLVASTRFGLGRALAEMGQRKRARVVLERALEDSRAKAGQPFPDPGAVASELAALSLATGDRRAALARLEEAVALHESWGADPEAIGTAAFALAELAWSMDYGAKAMAAARKALVAFDQASAHARASEVRRWLETRGN